MSEKESDQDQDLYKILEVDKNSTDFQIRKAYQAKAKVFHPDKNGSGCQEKFQQLNAAYKIQMDPEKRILYDNNLLFTEKDDIIDLGDASIDSFEFQDAFKETVNQQIKDDHDENIDNIIYQGEYFDIGSDLKFQNSDFTGTSDEKMDAKIFPQSFFNFLMSGSESVSKKPKPIRKTWGKNWKEAPERSQNYSEDTFEKYVYGAAKKQKKNVNKDIFLNKRTKI